MSVEIQPTKDNTAKIEWNVSGDVECPHCGHDNDFMNEDEWYGLCKVGESKKFNPPIIITCSKCKYEIAITESVF